MLIRIPSVDQGKGATAAMSQELGPEMWAAQVQLSWTHPFYQYIKYGTPVPVPRATNAAPVPVPRAIRSAPVPAAEVLLVVLFVNRRLLNAGLPVTRGIIYAPVPVPRAIRTAPVPVPRATKTLPVPAIEVVVLFVYSRLCQIGLPAGELDVS